MIFFFNYFTSRRENNKKISRQKITIDITLTPRKAIKPLGVTEQKNPSKIIIKK